MLFVEKCIKIKGFNFFQNQFLICVQKHSMIGIHLVDDGQACVPGYTDIGFGFHVAWLIPEKIPDPSFISGHWIKYLSLGLDHLGN